MNKNLEAKKITEEKAKELIIKKLLENSKNPNEIIEKITEEILKNNKLSRRNKYNKYKKMVKYIIYDV